MRVNSLRGDKWMTSLTWHEKQGLGGWGGSVKFLFLSDFWVTFFWCKILNFFEVICQRSLILKGSTWKKSLILDRFWVIFKNHSNFITVNLTSKLTLNRLFWRVHLGKITHFESILSDFQKSLKLHYCEFDVKDHSTSIILKFT